MSGRLQKLGIVLTLMGLVFVACGAFAFEKTQQGFDSLNALSAAQSVKLSYNDQREWDAMESRIHEAETRLAALETEAQRPDVVSDAARLVALDGEMTAARAEIDRLYARWAELEALLSA